jgi:hypothetical protein
MKSFCHHVALCVAIGMLLSTAFAVERTPIPARLPIQVLGCLSQQAIAPPLLNFDRSFLARAKAAACRLLGRASTGQAFRWLFTPRLVAVSGDGTLIPLWIEANRQTQPMQMAAVRDGGRDNRVPMLDPQHVRRLIQYTTTAREAIQVLAERIGWRPRPSALVEFLSEHGLAPPWPVKKRIQEINPQEVRRLIQYTNDARQAIDVLHCEFGWQPTQSALSSYLQRHGLTAPWQPHLDPEQVQELIRWTSSQREALAVLRDKLQWSIHPSTLSAYMKRHRLLAPWRRALLSTA